MPGVNKEYSSPRLIITTEIQSRDLKALKRAMRHAKIKRSEAIRALLRCGAGLAASLTPVELRELSRL
jgi:hypothetical protein